MFDWFFLFFVCRSQSRRHHWRNNIFKEHRFSRDHRKRDQSNNRQNRFKHHFEKNDIFNRIIKLAFSHVMFVVKWIFNQSLRLKYCFKHFKEFITMFFRKINKSDYVVFKTYRFIALLNILNKLMKSIMTTRLNYAAKKHNLLFKEHFENRKNIVSKHVLHYIIEIINLIWINKKITIMLLLNVIEVFDNIFHLRLLHNLKKRRIKSIYLT